MGGAVSLFEVTDWEKADGRIMADDGDSSTTTTGDRSLPNPTAAARTTTTTTTSAALENNDMEAPSSPSVGGDHHHHNAADDDPPVPSPPLYDHAVHDYYQASSRYYHGHSCTIDGLPPTKKYGIYYCIKKGMFNLNQREYEIIDEQCNLLYTTKPVPGTIACFDVYHAIYHPNIPLLRITVDISRRYWMIHRFHNPIFPGQLPDKTMTQQQLVIPAANTELATTEILTNYQSQLMQYQYITSLSERLQQQQTPQRSQPKPIPPSTAAVDDDDNILGTKMTTITTTATIANDQQAMSGSSTETTSAATTTAMTTTTTTISHPLEQEPSSSTDPTTTNTVISRTKHSNDASSSSNATNPKNDRMIIMPGLYKAGCITVSWSRYMAVSILYGPPTERQIDHYFDHITRFHHQQFEQEMNNSNTTTPSPLALSSSSLHHSTSTNSLANKVQHLTNKIISSIQASTTNAASLSTQKCHSSSTHRHSSPPSRRYRSRHSSSRDDHDDNSLADVDGDNNDDNNNDHDIEVAYMPLPMDNNAFHDAIIDQQDDDDEELFTNAYHIAIKHQNKSLLDDDDDDDDDDDHNDDHNDNSNTDNDDSHDNAVVKDHPNHVAELELTTVRHQPDNNNNTNVNNNDKISNNSNKENKEKKEASTTTTLHHHARSDEEVPSNDTNGDKIENEQTTATTTATAIVPTEPAEKDYHHHYHNDHPNPKNRYQSISFDTHEIRHMMMDGHAATTGSSSTTTENTTTTITVDGIEIPSAATSSMPAPAMCTESSRQRSFTLPDMKMMETDLPHSDVDDNDGNTNPTTNEELLVPFHNDYDKGVATTMRILQQKKKRRALFLLRKQKLDIASWMTPSSSTTTRTNITSGLSSTTTTTIPSSKTSSNHTSSTTNSLPVNQTGDGDKIKLSPKSLTKKKITDFVNKSITAASEGISAASAHTAQIMSTGGIGEKQSHYNMQTSTNDLTKTTMESPPPITSLADIEDPLEGTLDLDSKPIILCQEIYNKIIGNWQSSIISKQKTLELLKRDIKQHIHDEEKKHPHHHEPTSPPTSSFEQQVLAEGDEPGIELTLSKYENDDDDHNDTTNHNVIKHVSINSTDVPKMDNIKEYEGEQDVGLNITDESEGNDESNKNLVKQEQPQALDGQTTPQQSQGTSDQKQQQQVTVEEEVQVPQPLIGYWNWENTIRTHKMKMHIAANSDLALHVVMAILVNQVRYERNAIALTV